MFKNLLSATAIIAVISTSAFATNIGNTTNNTTNNNQQYGGAGGNGGTGFGVGIGQGGKGGNASAKGGNATQGQIQGQIGINENSVKSSNSNDSKVSKSGNSANVNGLSGSVNNTIGGDNFVEAENVVNTAYAPTVIATSDCLGSVSGGGMGTGFGASLGFTTNANPCNVREDAKLVAALTKDESLVKATLCQSDRVKEAFKVTGEYNKYCVGAKAVVKAAYFGLIQTAAYEEKDACAYPNSGSCIALRRK